MPGRKGSAFLRKPVKKPKKRTPKQVPKKSPVRKSGSLVPQALTEASSLLHLIQRMLEGTFAPANPTIKGYLQRAAGEVQDLLKQLTSTFKGGTPDPEVMEIAVAANQLLETVLAHDSMESVDLQAITKMTKRLNKGMRNETA
jgi:hypothetical protein